MREQGGPMRKRSTRTVASALLAGFVLAGGAVAQASTATTEPGGDATETTAAATEATEAAPTETPPPPTAPERGAADLVIWTDDTRQDTVQEIAQPFADE